MIKESLSAGFSGAQILQWIPIIRTLLIVCTLVSLVALAKRLKDLNAYMHKIYPSTTNAPKTLREGILRLFLDEPPKDTSTSKNAGKQAKNVQKSSGRQSRETPIFAINPQTKKRELLPQPYQIIGLKEFPQTLDDIRRVYKIKAKAHHPDLGGDEKKLVVINQAYQTSLELFNGKTRSTHFENQTNHP